MKQLKITVNGKSYDVQVEEAASIASAPAAPAQVAAPVTASAPAAAPIAAEAPAAPAQVSAPTGSAEGTPINAPMPGTINKVLVSAGQAVKKGEVLVVLESMKMENDIVAPNDGTIGGVMVTAGQSVNSAELLLTLK